MPIVKKNEPIGKRPVIIFIYGEPGIGKTSLFNTSDNPLLIDFDRGVDRSILRQDTLVVRSWEEVQAEESAGTFKGYKTIGIDTAKAALDDFLMSYVVKLDFKFKKNKLAAYGAIGDEFKVFVNNRRQEDGDIIIIAHAKDDKEGDVTRKIPDVTGGSYQLLLRIADQVGYMRTVNNRRTIQFEPTDITIGKNVARLPLIEIPIESDPAFRGFMASLINKVKDAINSQSESQREAVQKSEEYQDKLKECTTPESLTKLLEEVHSLPDYLKLPLQKLISGRAKDLGFVANKELKRFELPAGSSAPANDQPSAGETDKPSETNFDDRCKQLEAAGMTMEADQASKGDLVITYHRLGEMTEAEFAGFLNEAKVAKKRTTRKTQAA